MNRTLTLCLVVMASTVGAETIPHRWVEYFVDSGDIRSPSGNRSVTISEIIEVEGAPWIRLFLDGTTLGATGSPESSTVLRITSLEDGAVQELDAEALAQWGHSSAFFNGDAVRVEVVASPGAASSRLRITEVMAGALPQPGESICGSVDDRTLLNDARVARIVPVGCTAWLIDDAQGCFLTAGHCVGSTMSVIEFNVPLSDSDGSINHPGPEDQYAIDQSSLQWDLTVIGNDWAYFGAFPNAITELAPVEAQGATYLLGAPPASAGGETIRITGNGSVTGTQGTPLEWYLVHTTHTGPLTSVSGDILQYQVDTTGGDSGSAVLNEDSGTAIGIHTNAGCGDDGLGGDSGANHATALTNALLANALANPLGICSDGPPPFTVTLVSEIADPVPVDGASFDVSIQDRLGDPVPVTTADLIVDTGAGDVTVPMISQGGTLYRATLPAAACGSDMTFKLEVTAVGVTVHHPFSAENSADRRYRRSVGSARDATFYDTFETDQGWTVDDDPSLTAGTWQRGIPAGYGLRADPPWDGDSSGQCFLTGNFGGNTDVDGGATRLTSPRLDATGSDPHVAYWRWWEDNDSTDTFVVEISNDDGTTWTTLETVGPNVAGSWERAAFRIADFVTPTAEVRVRFTASDLGGGSVIEAAVDGFVLSNTSQELQCDLFSDDFETGSTDRWSGTS
jgi:hypothetical protein